MTSSAYPEGHPMRIKHGDDKVLIRGGSCAIDPLGTILVEPEFHQRTHSLCGRRPISNRLW
ncbi:hypothetical protein COOONC_17678 [Cooperia oncophora]